MTLSNSPRLLDHGIQRLFNATQDQSAQPAAHQTRHQQHTRQSNRGSPQRVIGKTRAADQSDCADLVPAVVDLRMSRLGNQRQKPGKPERHVGIGRVRIFCDDRFAEWINHPDQIVMTIIKQR